jgi:tousled-like kinase
VDTPKKKLLLNKTESKKITEYLGKKKLSDKKKKVRREDDDSFDIRDELQNVSSQLVEKDLALKEKLNQMDGLLVEQKELKEKYIQQQEKNNHDTNRLNRAVETVKTLLLECEKFRRAELKQNTSMMKFRYGEFELSRECAKISEQWVDGYEIKDVKAKLRGIDREKEELEKKKKNKYRREEE